MAEAAGKLQQHKKRKVLYICMYMCVYNTLSLCVFVCLNQLVCVCTTPSPSPSPSLPPSLCVCCVFESVGKGERSVSDSTVVFDVVGLHLDLSNYLELYIA